MQAIQRALETYLDARVAGNVELWLSIWDEDGVQLFPGSRASTKELLSETTPARFESVPVNSAEIKTDDITVAGEYAIAYGHFHLERAVDDEPIHFDGKLLTILRQQTDKSWKIFRDCSNSNDH